MNGLIIRLMSGVEVYHLFNRYDGDQTLCYFPINCKNVKYWTKQEFDDFMHKFIDCVEIEYVGAYNSEDNIEYSNSFSIIDRKNIVITDSVRIDLETNFNITSTFGQNYEPDILADNSSIIAISKDEDYQLSVMETSGESIETLKEAYNNGRYSWETCTIGNDELQFAYDEKGRLAVLYIEVDGQLVYFTIEPYNMDNSRIEEAMNYEKALTYLGDVLFLPTEE